MGITINPKPPATGGGTGEDIQLRQQFGQHKDDSTHLKQEDKTTIAASKLHMDDSGAHMRVGDTTKIDGALQKTGGTMTGGIVTTTYNPMIIKYDGFKSHQIHKGNQDGHLYIVPSKSINQEDWDWAKSVSINTDGDINISGKLFVDGVDLKQSASEVKDNVAQALTDRGYPTSPDATGKQMADTIRAIPSGGSQSVSGNYTLGFGIQTLPYVPFKPKAFRAIYTPNGFTIKAQFSAVINESDNTLVGGIEQNMQNFVIAGLLQDANGYALQLINTTSNNINLDFTYYG